MIEPKLKPCPFCGCEVHVKDVYNEEYCGLVHVGYVVDGRHDESCPLDLVMMDYWTDMDELEESWNGRA